MSGPRLRVAARRCRRAPSPAGSSPSLRSSAQLQHCDAQPLALVRVILPPFRLITPPCTRHEGASGLYVLHRHRLRVGNLVTFCSMDHSRNVAPDCLHTRPLPVVVLDDRLVGVESLVVHLRLVLLDNQPLRSHVLCLRSTMTRWCCVFSLSCERFVQTSSRFTVSAPSSS